MQFKGMGNGQRGLDQLRELLKISLEKPLPRDVGVALGEARPCLIPRDPWGQRQIWVGPGDGSLEPLQGT